MAHLIFDFQDGRILALADELFECVWPFCKIGAYRAIYLCLIVGGEGSNCKFLGKKPQVHLIIIREWPNDHFFQNVPILMYIPKLQ